MIYVTELLLASCICCCCADDPVWVLYLAFSQVSDRDNLPGIMLQEALERCLQSSKE